MIGKKILQYYQDHFVRDINQYQNINPNVLANKRMDLYLYQEKLINKNQLKEIWNVFSNLQIDEITYFHFNKNTLKKTSLEWKKYYNMIPFDETLKNVKVLIDDPLDFSKISLIELVFRKKPLVYYKDKTEITYLINLLSLNIDISDNPLKVDKIIDSLINLAIDCNASDMHFEINNDYVALHYRIDGMIVNLMEISLDLYHLILTKIKILSNLDVTISLKPQDGHFTYFKNKNKLDIRTSTIPTIDGERLALRFLDESNNPYNLDNIGLSEIQLKTIKKWLNGSGIIFVTGPTGSGKTTTLYAILEYLKEMNVNIMTIEDPIEKRIDKITQIPLNMMDYHEILKSIVRQDPDVLMVGEVRDLETANMVIKMAQTGHKILATIHSTSSVGVISRLINLGVPKYLLEDSIRGIISQRLVRKICPHCKSFQGCSKCYQTGYLGRQIICELLDFNNDIKNLLYLENYQTKIAEYIKDQSLSFQAYQLLIEGKTTHEELVRLGLID